MKVLYRYAHMIRKMYFRYLNAEKWLCDSSYIIQYVIRLLLLTHSCKSRISMSQLAEVELLFRYLA